MMTKKYYKVLLADGRSTHRSMPWSLPLGGVPGEWHRVTGELELCGNGLHLTDAPAVWWGYGMKIYETEYEGVGQIDSDDSKVVVRAARLLREITDSSELAALGIFTDGEHEVREGFVHVCGSAQLKAYDSAIVMAHDSAEVTAYDSSHVMAHDSSHVTAYDSAEVKAYDSASVIACGSAQVTACGSAEVTAYDSAIVMAHDSAEVTAYDSVRVTDCRNA